MPGVRLQDARNHLSTAPSSIRHGRCQAFPLPRRGRLPARTGRIAGAPLRHRAGQADRLKTRRESWPLPLANAAATDRRPGYRSGFHRRRPDQLVADAQSDMRTQQEARCRSSVGRPEQGVFAGIRQKVIIKKGRPVTGRPRIMCCSMLISAASGNRSAQRRHQRRARWPRPRPWLRCRRSSRRNRLGPRRLPRSACRPFPQTSGGQACRPHPRNCRSCVTSRRRSACRHRPCAHPTGHHSCRC